MVRQLSAVAGVMLLLACTACNCEEARRKESEAQRAVRLEQKLAKLQADFANRQWLDPPVPKSKNFDRLVPEWKGYHETLAVCDRQLGETLEKVAARRIPEIAGPALEGWRRSAGLAEDAAARMLQIVRADAPGSPRGALEANDQLGYYNGVMRMASVYAGVFLRTLDILAQQGPRADRAAVFEQLAALQPATREPMHAQAIADVLRGAWVAEDDPVLKARMEQKLKKLNLPSAKGK